MSKRKFILKVKEDMSSKNIEKLNRTLGEEFLVIPNKYEISGIEEEGYKIFTKDKYIEYRLCGMKPWDVSKGTIKALHEQWDKHRKGYDFVILAGDMTYSVDYFNTVVLGGNRKHCISKEDILLGNISIEGFKEEVLYNDDGIIQIIFSKEDE
ncbi:hypothetical protein UT300003_07640 [Clostridium sardiniense]